jgi:mono/diheme cytochrome c family protein
MTRQLAVRRYVSMASMLLGCVAEPSGIPRTDDALDGSTAGQPSQASTASDACEALRVLTDKCGRCHGARPKHGAPFELTSFEALREVDAKGVTRRERAAAAVERGDMPALFIELDPPVQDLDAEERETLLAWLGESDALETACE